MTLRNPRINYRDGWFFVTTQNELGRRVADAWTGTLAHFPQIVPDAFVVMPNHFHAVLLIKPAPENQPNQLSYVMQCFKSFAGNAYLELLRGHRCVDNGAHLWHPSFYDEIITDTAALTAIRRYVRENPARWDGDRFGEVTAHHVGNLELLNQELVAFVASEGWSGTPPKPRLVKPADSTADSRERVGAHLSRQVAAPSATPLPVISTFTSPEERAVLSKCLASKRPFIRIMPGGIPETLPPEIAAACAEGWGLLLSPTETGIGMNKQRAIWCNRYVIGQAGSVWCGTVRSGGTLETLLRIKQA